MVIEIHTRSSVDRKERTLWATRVEVNREERCRREGGVVDKTICLELRSSIGERSEAMDADTIRTL